MICVIPNHSYAFQGSKLTRVLGNTENLGQVVDILLGHARALVVIPLLLLSIYNI